MMMMIIFGVETRISCYKSKYRLYNKEWLCLRY